MKIRVILKYVNQEMIKGITNFLEENLSKVIDLIDEIVGEISIGIVFLF